MGCQSDRHHARVVDLPLELRAFVCLIRRRLSQLVWLRRHAAFRGLPAAERFFSRSAISSIVIAMIGNHAPSTPDYLRMIEVVMTVDGVFDRKLCVWAHHSITSLIAVGVMKFKNNVSSPPQTSLA